MIYFLAKVRSKHFVLTSKSLPGPHFLSLHPLHPCITSSNTLHWTHKAFMVLLRGTLSPHISPKLMSALIGRFLVLIFRMTFLPTRPNVLHIHSPSLTNYSAIVTYIGGTIWNLFFFTSSCVLLKYEMV